MASEKIPETSLDDASPTNSSIHDATVRDTTVEELGISEPTNGLQRFANKLDRLAGVEARGIDRVPEELRERPMAIKDYVHMFTM